MKKETYEAIKNFILTFAKRVVAAPYTTEELKRAFPFHAIFFPEEALISFKQQRTLVTRMGLQLYPAVAEIVAKDKYSKVYRNYEISSELDVALVTIVDTIINELRAQKRKPNYHLETQEILTSAKKGTNRNIRVIADLFIGDFESGPLFFEIKSPRPNLDVCAESKKKMLFFRAIYTNKNPQAFLAFPYNPFIYRDKYAHSFTKQIMDMENEVLLGEEMWNLLGGKGTYDQLMEIIEEVRYELKKKSE